MSIACVDSYTQSNKLMWSDLIRGLDNLIEKLGQLFWLAIVSCHEIKPRYNSLLRLWRLQLALTQINFVSCERTTWAVTFTT